MAVSEVRHRPTRGVPSYGRKNNLVAFGTHLAKTILRHLHPAALLERVAGTRRRSGSGLCGGLHGGHVRMSVEWGGSVGPRSPKDGLFLALTAAPLHSCVTESSARSALALYPLRARAHTHAHTCTLIYTHKEMDLDLTPSPLAPRAEASSPAVPADGTPDDGAPPGRGRAGAGTGGGTATPGATTQGGRADQDSRLFQQAVRDLRQRLKSDKV